MADYNTITKIFVQDVSSNEISTTSGSLAMTVNDYIQTLDSTDNAIVSMTSAVSKGPPNVNTGRLFITLVHTG